MGKPFPHRWLDILRGAQFALLRPSPLELPHNNEHYAMHHSLRKSAAVLYFKLP